VRLLVAGDGEEKANLEALCRQLRLDRVVTFSGWVDNRNIRAIYEQIDVLVVPSVWPENSPVIISEAMASGIPVIASDIGGIPELVRDEVTGLLAPPRDARAFADAIERLRKDPDLRARMGQRALETIRQEGLRGQVMQVAQIFEELPAAPRATGDADVSVVLYSSDLYWHRSLHEMLRQLAHVEEGLGRRLLVCRLDLSDEETRRAAKLIVLPTPSRASFLDGLRALQMQIPLVVNDHAHELKELCRQSNAGLAYSEAAELRECLELLLTDEPLRKAMGANGHKFIGALATELRADG
jgi:glycosyltransferase involved in cell wall biosynthesis